MNKINKKLTKGRTMTKNKNKPTNKWVLTSNRLPVADIQKKIMHWKESKDYPIIIDGYQGFRIGHIVEYQDNSIQWSINNVNGDVNVIAWFDIDNFDYKQNNDKEND